MCVPAVAEPGFSVAPVRRDGSQVGTVISGRMNASIRFLVWDTIPLCGLLGGALGEILSLRATLLVAVVGGVLAPGWLLASPLRGLRDLPVN
ncbi:MAG: hypothetical protein QOH09_1391 [Pseudonocardiales bacterium]|nr:hypothetical protein [Pseudonocardiales bacterium]